MHLISSTWLISSKDVLRFSHTLLLHFGLMFVLINNGAVWCVIFGCIYLILNDYFHYGLK